MNLKLMTHVVAGYPSIPECIDLLLGMQSVGVFMVEIQIPFSDPSADGPTIMKANDIALQNNMTTERCFSMVESARNRGLELPLYLMTYLNKPLSFGFEQFCQQARKNQLAGLIIPDLPPDND